MNRNRILAIVLGLIFLVVCALAVLFILNERNITAAPPTLPTLISMPMPTPMATPWIRPTRIPAVTEWTFQSFTNETSVINGSTYYWATFIGNNGRTIKAMCPAPNSPAPETGAIYNWDRRTNILYPVSDNSAGNLQRFWYPTFTGQ